MPKPPAAAAASTSSLAPASPRTKLLVRAQIDKLPDWLMVGGFTVRISRFHDADFSKRSCWGHYRHYDRAILISDDCTSLGHLGNTFLHEVLHAIWDVSKVQTLVAAIEDADELEEMTVDVASLGLWQVYRDNPWFLPWVADCLRFDHNRPALE